MEWKRTGKITMRSGDYLIMRLILHPQYLAMHGPQLARQTIGRYHTGDEAIAACEAHSATIGEKEATA